MITTLSILLSLACTGEVSDDPKPDDKELTEPAETPSLEAPSDVAAAPADATKTESGLAYKVITQGPGGEKPTQWDSVEVHYIGWTTDGENFDSSYKRNKPASFPLKGVIAGWTEGLQLMAVGDKVRFWIPEELAYKGSPGKPAGMLVFDVDLVSVKAGTRPPETPENVAAAPAEAKSLSEGLKIMQLTAGEGDMPSGDDMVEFHMTAWDTTTQEFEFGTSMRGKPMSGRLSDMMQVWAETLATMKPGEKTMVWASADKIVDGRGNPAEAAKTFQLELLKVTSAPKPPKSVAKAPSSAKTTESGLAFQVLTPGTGETHPTASDRVMVHYSGWTTDGKLFDSSVQRGEAATFGLGQVIPGWTEGLQLMVLGEKTLFWIPKELAYDGKPGRPEGMLVFEVELLEIKGARELPTMAIPPKPAAE